MVQFGAAALIGILIGVTELVNRYRDAPGKVLFTAPACLYLAINGMASTIALLLVQTFDFDFGLGESPNLVWIKVLASGFSAMALFRSSLFVVRVGDQDVGIGPSSLLQIVLGAVDRAVDRMRGKNRAREVARIMDGIAFTKAFPELTSLCLALMQNLPEEEQDLLARDYESLVPAEMRDEVKVFTMGLSLMTAVGPHVLQAAVDMLGNSVKSESPVDIKLG